MKEFKLKSTYLTGSPNLDRRVITGILIAIVAILFTVGAVTMFMKEVIDPDALLMPNTTAAWQIALVVLCIFFIMQILRMARLYAKGYTWSMWNNDDYDAKPVVSFNLDFETIGIISFFYFFAALLAPLIGMVVAKFVLVSVINMSLWMISVLMVFLVAAVAFTISYFARKRALEKIEVFSKLRGH